MKILLAITGSVAAKVTPKIVSGLVNLGHEVRVIVTKTSVYFWDPYRVPVSASVYQDKDEWPNYQYCDDQRVLHIDLREWADLLLVAPLSFNTLGKFANGLADNLVTSVLAAWNRKKPIVLAPAMNTQMWENPVVAENLLRLKNRYSKLTIVDPISKKLACKTKGVGALANIETILEAVEKGGTECAP